MSRKILLLFYILLLIIEVELKVYNIQNDNDSINELDNLLNDDKRNSNKSILNNDREYLKQFQREKKYISQKKKLNEIGNHDEQEKPIRRTHLSKSKNRTDLSNKSNRLSQTTKTARNYFDEASLCINEYDVRSELLVKVKELKNGARMIRFVQIEEPSTSHGLDIKDICMLNCCVEEYCDLAMLSEQRTNDGYKCYLFACNGSCTYASHQDYTSMILKKDLPINDDSSVTNKQSKSSDATSSTISTTCKSIEFSCRDGTCIPYYDVCNSYDDCSSGIDEAMCSSEFSLHQRTQQENRKKPSADVDTDTNTDIDESLDEISDDDQLTTTIKTPIKLTNTKSSSSKSKSKNREEGKQDKNSTSQFFYNIDSKAQERISRLQKLKEYLEETKGPEAWYHLYQTLIQHQNQDHSNLETEQTGSGSSNDDDDNFHEHLLALEQQWIADRQKPSTTTTMPTTKIMITQRIKPVPNRKTTTTKRMKLIKDDEDEFRLRRPPPVIEDEITNDEDVYDRDRYYWQPTYDDRSGNVYSNYEQKIKSTTSTKKSKTKYPQINRDMTMTILLPANNIDAEDFSHTKSFLRESSVVFLFLLGLVLTIILLVLVGFYCRDSWKHGRLLKNRSTDADYLINGLYL